MQVIKMLVLIIVLFTIAWGPFLIDSVLISFGVVDKLHLGHLRPMRMVFALLAYSNSCINPIVYAFMSKNFRQCFQTTFMSIIRRSHRPSDSDAPRRDSITAARRTSTTVLTSVRPTFVKMDSGTFLAVKV